jgi:hypothetical protein
MAGVPFLEDVPLVGSVFGPGGLLGGPVQVPTGPSRPLPPIPESVLQGLQIGAPQTGGLTAAQQAVLGLMGPQATPYAQFSQPGGLFAPIAAPRQIAGGQVGGALPTVAQAQAGQAPQLFGAPIGGVPQIGGMYGWGGPMGPQFPPPVAPPPMPRGPPGPLGARYPWRPPPGGPTAPPPGAGASRPLTGRAAIAPATAQLPRRTAGIPAPTRTMPAVRPTARATRRR